MATPEYVSVYSFCRKDPPAHSAVQIEAEMPRDPDAGWLPVYDLQAVASEFGPSVAADCLGWVQVPELAGRGEGCFVSQVSGHAMQPLIPDGAYCVFRFAVPAARTGRVLLVQHHAIGDPETGGSYTVARYRSVKVADSESSDEPGWHHESIQLVPANPAFSTISITPEQAADLRVIAEFIRVIGDTTERLTTARLRRSGHLGASTNLLPSSPGPGSQIGFTPPGNGSHRT